MALPKVRGIFSHVREYPPCTPKRTQGAPAHWQFVARITARAAQCGRGVHGFAMNPYYTRYRSQPRLTIVRRE